MKLSEAIEQMLVTPGCYSPQNEYMCHVLSANNLGRFKSDVEDMVLTIHQSYRGVPLVCALHESRIINMNNMGWREMFDYTTQLYVWWVFDLKRKGL